MQTVGTGILFHGLSMLNCWGVLDVLPVFSQSEQPGQCFHFEAGFFHVYVSVPKAILGMSLRREAMNYTRTNLHQNLPCYKAASS